MLSFHKTVIKPGAYMFENKLLESINLHTTHVRRYSALSNDEKIEKRNRYSYFFKRSFFILMTSNLLLYFEAHIYGVQHENINMVVFADHCSDINQNCPKSDNAVYREITRRWD